MKIRVINGPNLNMLGIREPDIYGTETYDALTERITRYAEQKGIELNCFQSNHEGDLVDEIQSAYGQYDGIILNPAAYTHTSIAIADAVKAIGLPVVEVHISEPETREPFRHVSYVRECCIATVSGMGTDGYCRAVDILEEYLHGNSR